MRMIQLFAAIALSAGLVAATPAAAETRTATAPTTVATPIAKTGILTTSADQYRSRSRYRYRAGWRQYRYRPRYYANRGWRRGGARCRPVWRYGRPERICVRRW